jgi:uncharacterized membrane protein (UPF0127 family)
MSMLAAFASCKRTPEELAPSPSSGFNPQSPVKPIVKQPAAVASDTPDADWGDRCVLLTSKDPPPPVPPGPAAGCPPDTGNAPVLPVVSVAFPDASGQKVEVEVARYYEERQRGLMFRRSLDEDKGMLFRMDEHENHQFWMKNTCIPLDIMFVDDDGLIVGIVENVPTLNTSPLREVGCPSSWVLEVNAGWSRRHGVVAGQKMSIPDDARK